MWESPASRWMAGTMTRPCGISSSRIEIGFQPYGDWHPRSCEPRSRDLKLTAPRTSSLSRRKSASMYSDQDSSSLVGIGRYNITADLRRSSRVARRYLVYGPVVPTRICVLERLHASMVHHPIPGLGEASDTPIGGARLHGVLGERGVLRLRFGPGLSQQEVDFRDRPTAPRRVLRRYRRTRSSFFEFRERRSCAVCNLGK